MTPLYYYCEVGFHRAIYDAIRTALYKVFGLAYHASLRSEFLNELFFALTSQFEPILLSKKVNSGPLSANASLRRSASSSNFDVWFPFCAASPLWLNLYYNTI